MVKRSPATVADRTVLRFERRRQLSDLVRRVRDHAAGRSSIMHAAQLHCDVVGDRPSLSVACTNGMTMAVASLDLADGQADGAPWFRVYVPTGRLWRTLRMFAPGEPLTVTVHHVQDGAVTVRSAADAEEGSEGVRLATVPAGAATWPSWPKFAAGILGKDLLTLAPAGTGLDPDHLARWRRAPGPLRVQWRDGGNRAPVLVLSGPGFLGLQMGKRLTAEQEATSDPAVWREPGAEPAAAAAAAAGGAGR